MAEADVTYHSLVRAQSPNLQGGGVEAAPVRGVQSGNSEQLDFTSASQLGAVQSVAVVACIIPDAASRVRVFEGTSTGITVANSKKLIVDQENDVFVPAGSRIEIGAPS